MELKRRHIVALKLCEKVVELRFEGVYTHERIARTRGVTIGKRDDVEVLKKLDDAENLLKSLRKALTSS